MWAAAIAKCVRSCASRSAAACRRESSIRRAFSYPMAACIASAVTTARSLSLTLGGLGAAPRAHAADTVHEPRRCPSGGFPLAASFSFADRSTSQAAAHIPCP